MFRDTYHLLLWIKVITSMFVGVGFLKWWESECCCFPLCLKWVLQACVSLIVKFVQCFVHVNILCRCGFIHSEKWKCKKHFLSHIALLTLAAENKFAKFLLTCLKCCFWCLDKFIKFLNRNAYIMVRNSNLSSSPAELILIFRYAPKMGLFPSHLAPSAFSANLAYPFDSQSFGMRPWPLLELPPP